MSLKASLILLTIVSVICDSMVLPFYPQFFSQAFGINNPEHTGYYIAACCVTVMVAFPFWAQIAKRYNEVHIWIYTQIASCILGIACYYASSITEFWILSQLMLVFKASYLLIYPYVMRLEDGGKHLNIAGLFSVLMHFGAIGGALLGGITLEWMRPQDLYLIMALGDAIQVVVCLYLVRRFQIMKYTDNISSKKSVGLKLRLKNIALGIKIPQLKPFVWQLGLLSLFFYFAAFSIRPFLSLYWESISQFDSKVISGVVYAIPGWIALIGLWLNHQMKERLSPYQKIVLALLWTLVGSLVQSSSHDQTFILGRVIYAWGLFQVTVNLEVLLFQLSKPDDYASDYSQVHVFQNLGVIVASFGTGYLVSNVSLIGPFYLSACLLATTLILFFLFYGRRVLYKSFHTEQPFSSSEEITSKNTSIETV
ncbi:MFS transporter [Pleionea sediminis]|uniref:MFS transporter n=1 Tax=Pleionea sediminis TaxID=2569479 RepID=UPI001185918D|nr:MFS transporter [Pleionea sediminis]